MYQSYFQFESRPFPAPPQADFYVPIASWEETLQTVARVIERAEGPALVVGGVGTGKSLLCHLLSAHYGKVFRVAMLSSARLCTSRALLQNLLFELQLPYRDLSEGELRLSLMEALEPDPENRHGMLLIVDEAQSLPMRLLEEIRMLTNLVRGGESRVRLVLAGTTRLEEQFAHPRMESFNQRLACRCYLESLTSEETGYYIQSQLQSVNGGESVDIFDKEAVAAIHKLTDGVPRLINQLCDHALLAAAAAATGSIDSRGVEMAWADLQQLPATFTTEESPATTANVIEFGQLDDFGEEANTDRMEETAPEPGVIEIGALDEPVAGTVDENMLEQPASEATLGAHAQDPAVAEPVQEESRKQLLPLEPAGQPSSQDSPGEIELLPLADAAFQVQQSTETEWIVSVDFKDETTNTASQDDPEMLIIRRDGEHPVGPDHQPISADALESQRQLLDRFRQA